MRFIDGEPSINVQIAHICALDERGPRFEQQMSVAHRNNFGNLLLLCQAHHIRVDSKAYEHAYPKAVLHAWKRAREGDAAADLVEVQVSDARDLQQVFTDVVTDAKEDILDAIARVEDISANTARMLRSMVAEVFDRPRLDLDAVESLERSARMLTNLEDTAGMLHAATAKINDDTVFGLQSAATDLADAVKDAEQISRSLSVGSGSEPQVHYYVADDRRWQFFARGMAVGAGVIIVIAILIARATGKSG
ncbi:hypothetical protein [Kribbella sp. NPDC003557]|uniref:hypothetical protein n=1 Tax=Kribbella sp. NPDC003557 TaxID=3154449 RepID=UPI0033A6B0A8